MGKSEKAILTNMCMVYDGDHILVQDRVSSNWPGITFPGGHIEKEESFSESVIREVYEETGLVIKQPQLCGVKQFQTKNDERYIVFFYKSEQYEGELTSSDEGNVFWIHKEQLKDYSLASDFEHMFKVFESDYLSEFHYDRRDGNWNMKLL
ncbi:8-oxo-dGTP diphosphatase [Filobacillus milosensis]|uniref:8-oxo-dGTP diphosphatase n=1 Tax=Filobacillus milosensis TaxID=94137 RepID=A0A4Y8IGG3_9BACI|nr:8-oxo-dGTP diphosphatase [Filobacillus milosensis]TFB14247.1 8-oxo-dGTP diphosphatase [Filobacillus milosensis]